jgi:hypothetical protein
MRSDKIRDISMNFDSIAARSLDVFVWRFRYVGERSALG